MSTARDPQALLAHTHWIQSLARSLVRDPNLADDLAQATWLDALEQEPDTSRPIRGWLATVMRNNLGKLLRSDANRRAREERHSRREAVESTIDVLEKAATHRDVVLAVLDLDEPYRSTLLLRYFEQLPYREIMERTGVTRAAVNSRISRGLAQLRERLESQYGSRRAFHLALAPLACESSRVGGPLLGAKMLTIALASATLVTLGVVVGLSELREGREGVSPPQQRTRLGLHRDPTPLPHLRRRGPGARASRKRTVTRAEVRMTRMDPSRANRRGGILTRCPGGTGAGACSARSERWLPSRPSFGV